METTAYAIFKLADQCQKFGDLHSVPGSGKCIHWNFSHLEESDDFTLTQPGKYMQIRFSDPNLLPMHTNEEVSDIIQAQQKLQKPWEEFNFRCIEITAQD